MSIYEKQKCPHCGEELKRKINFEWLGFRRALIRDALKGYAGYREAYKEIWGEEFTEKAYNRRCREDVTF